MFFEISRREKKSKLRRAVRFWVGTLLGIGMSVSKTALHGRTIIFTEINFVGANLQAGSLFVFRRKRRTIASSSTFPRLAIYTPFHNKTSQFLFPFYFCCIFYFDGVAWSSVSRELLHVPGSPALCCFVDVLAAMQGASLCGRHIQSRLIPGS
jgi:hypothetical protein